MKAYDFEIGAAHDGSLNFSGLTEAHHAHADGRKITKFRDGVDAGFEVLDFGNGEIDFIHADPLGALLNVNEAVFIGVDERLKQDAAYQAEDGGVGADAERQSSDDGEREAWGAHQRAKSEPQILNEQHQRMHRSPPARS